MRYIERNSDGKIIATFAVRQFPEQETLPDDHPDLQQPQLPKLTPEQKLAASGLTIDELKQLLGLN